MHQFGERTRHNPVFDLYRVVFYDAVEEIGPSVSIVFNEVVEVELGFLKLTLLGVLESKNLLIKCLHK